MNCGTQNTEGARFCASCGQSLQITDTNPYYPQPAASSSLNNLPWKWIAIAGGGLVVLAGIIVLIVVLVNGGFGAGQLTRCDWYQPDQQMYLTFNRDGTIVTHDSYSTSPSNFNYVLEDPDILIIISPELNYGEFSYRYVIDNDTLILYDLSGSSTTQTYFVCQDYIEPEQREK
ncbi:MAG TPA: zinc ribbon domain-containing protein [Longilinea sp.]|nr:zinc ribbon domain-containing protein [Longilinea sp.]